MSYNIQHIELYDSTTAMERAKVEFLWALLPRWRTGIPNRNEAQYKETIWFMRKNDVDKYERQMSALRDKFSEWTQRAPAYRYTSLRDLLGPYGEEVLAYYKHVYLDAKYEYLDDPQAAADLSSAGIPPERVLNKHVARVLEQDKPRAAKRKRRIVNGVCILYDE